MMAFLPARMACMSTKLGATKVPSVSRGVAINKRILESADDHRKFFQLMRELRSSPDDLNAENVVTGLYTMAKGKWKIGAESSWLIDVLSDKVDQIGARDLPNIVWALSHLPEKVRAKVIEDVAAHASYQLRNLSLVSLAAVLRGFAHMRVSWDVLWSSASIEITQRSPELCPLSFSNILWSLGVVQRPCLASALPALCLFGANAAPQMNATDVGSCLWAATRLDIRHRPFLGGLIERADNVAEKFDEIGLTRVVHALSYFCEKDAALLSKLSHIIAERMDAMAMENVARLADALSRFPRDHPALADLAILRNRMDRLLLSRSSRDPRNKPKTT